MVKTPRTRHSKTKRNPVTIELDPGAVSRVSDTPEGDSASTIGEPEYSPELEGYASTSGVENEEGVTAGAEKSTADVEPSSYDFDDAVSGQPASGPSEEPLESTAPPQERSRLPIFAAGIVGGIVTLAGAGILQFAGVLGTPAKPGIMEPASSQVENDITSLKAEVAALKESVGSAAGGDPARVEDLSKALDQIRTDVGSLQKAIESGKAGDTAGLQALGGRIDELETRISGLAQDQGGVAPDDIAGINEKIAGLETLAKAAGESDSAIDGRLGVIEQKLNGLSAKVEAQAEQPKIALAIASAALKSAVERGVAFQSEIETFAAISPDSPEIADLRKYAESGVATRTEILAETDAAANAMIAAAAPPKKDAGFFERLLSSAESLVTVRPIGTVEGVGVPETVARMEVAIQAGDLNKALVEYDSLPEASRAAGAAFAEKIRARMEVEKLVDQAVASAMKAE